MLNVVSRQKKDEWATACPSKHSTMFYHLFQQEMPYSRGLAGLIQSSQCLHGTTRSYDKHHLPNCRAEDSRVESNGLMTKALAKSCEVSSRHLKDSERACHFWIHNLHWLQGAQGSLSSFTTNRPRDCKSPRKGQKKPWKEKSISLATM